MEYFHGCSRRCFASYWGTLALTAPPPPGTGRNLAKVLLNHTAVYVRNMSLRSPHIDLSFLTRRFRARRNQLINYLNRTDPGREREAPRAPVAPRLTSPLPE